MYSRHWQATWVTTPSREAGSFVDEWFHKRTGRLKLMLGTYTAADWVLTSGVRAIQGSQSGEARNDRAREDLLVIYSIGILGVVGA